MKRLVLALIIVFLLMLIQGLFPNFSLALSIISITSGDRADNPQIHNNRIVYQRYKNPNDPIDPDIYMYDLNTKSTRAIVLNSYGQVYPDIYNNNVVWQDTRNTTYQNYNSDIYLLNIQTNTEKQITTDALGQGNPKIFNNIIVYEEADNISMYDLSTNSVTPVTSGPNTERGPDIYGNYVVWEQSNNTTPRDIYLKNISTGSVQAVTTASGDQTRPAIYGNRVVWEDTRNGQIAVYMKDLSNNIETPIASKGHSPDIFSDTVVWVDYRNQRNEIYAKNLVTGIEKRITYEGPFNYVTPAIDEDKIVWSVDPGTTYQSIGMTDIAAPVTSVNTNPATPDGNNGYFKNPPIVWLNRNEPGVSYYLWNSLSLPWQTFINPLVPTRGTNTLFYYSIDVAGNVEGINSKAVNVEQLNIAISPAPVNPTPPKKKVRVATNFHKKKCKNKKFHAKHCKVSSKLQKKKSYKKLVKAAKRRHLKKCTKIIQK